MKLFGKTVTARQNDSEAPQSFPLPAQAQHCYRVYVQGEAGIADLHVAIEDSEGAVAGQDFADGPRVVVPKDGAVCFEAAGSANVVVSVGRGGGAYSLQIWGD
jgi:hypothetical protein